MAETKETPAKVTISIAQVKEDLANGIDRTQMKAKYGLKRADIIRLFKDPRLKGLKVKRESTVEPGFVIAEDLGATNGTGTTTTDNASVQEAATQTTEESKGW